MSYCKNDLIFNKKRFHSSRERITHILILVISSVQFNTHSTDSAVKKLCIMNIPAHKEVNLLGSNSALGLERRRRAEAADSASISSTSPSSSFSSPSCSSCSSLTVQDNIWGDRVDICFCGCCLSF